MKSQSNRNSKPVRPTQRSRSTARRASRSTNGGIASASQTNMTQNLSNEANFDTDDISNKIKFWKKFSLITGLVVFFWFIISLVGGGAITTHEAYLGEFFTDVMVVFTVVMIIGPALLPILLALSIISLVRIKELSAKRKKHILKDYIIAIIGLLLICSPYAILALLQLLMIRNTSI